MLYPRFFVFVWVLLGCGSLAGFVGGVAHEITATAPISALLAWIAACAFVATVVVTWAVRAMRRARWYRETVGGDRANVLDRSSVAYLNAYQAELKRGVSGLSVASLLRNRFPLLPTAVCRALGRSARRGELVPPLSTPGTLREPQRGSYTSVHRAVQLTMIVAALSFVGCFVSLLAVRGLWGPTVASGCLAGVVILLPLLGRLAMIERPAAWYQEQGGLDERKRHGVVSAEAQSAVGRLASRPGTMIQSVDIITADARANRGFIRPLDAVSVVQAIRAVEHEKRVAP